MLQLSIVFELRLGRCDCHRLRTFETTALVLYERLVHKLKRTKTHENAGTTQESPASGPEISMNQLVDLYDRIVGHLAHFDGVASIALRLILGPVMMAAGWEKMHGDNWFAFSLDSFPFPFNILPPELSWFLAKYTEFFGGMLLLVGLFTRGISAMLIVVMFVAAYSVHWDNGWAAVAPSNPDAVCIADSPAAAEAGAMDRWLKCLNVNERTIEASERLSRAKSILREHGNFQYLNGSGSIVKLNSGIEFAMMYMVMLAALVIIGGGRYLSLDFWLGLFLRRGR